MRACRRPDFPFQHSTLNIQHSSFSFFSSPARPHRDTTEHLEFWGLGREGEVVTALLPQFEKENPGIKVTVQQIPWSGGA